MGKIGFQENVAEILPDFYRIRIPLTGNPLKSLNSYVIKGEKNLLIDTGFRTEECRTVLLNGLQSIGVSMEKTDILLTHMHSDHSGNAPDLIQGDNRIMMGKADIEYIVPATSGNGFRNHASYLPDRLAAHGIPAEMIAEMYEKTPSRSLAPDPDFTDYTPVEDGQEIPAGDYVLRAVHTPGHSPGHMCFEVVGTGAMILGDHVLFDITPNITDYAGITDSLGVYLESLEKIKQYLVEIPLPGHRMPGDFYKRIEELQVHHKKRIEECRDIISRLGMACLYDIAGNMTWKIRAAGWDDFPAAQRWFALGECLAHIDYLVMRNEVKRIENGEIVLYQIS